MTIEEALASLGKEFKILDMPGMKFDTIRSVSSDGTVTGDFIEAHCSDIRIKEEQPEHLKKHHHGTN